MSAAPFWSAATSRVNTVPTTLTESNNAALEFDATMSTRLSPLVTMSTSPKTALRSSA